MEKLMTSVQWFQGHTFSLSLGDLVSEAILLQRRKLT